MDFSLTEEQRDVAGLARQILEDQVTHDSLSRLERSGEPRFDQQLWQQMAKADLLGVGLSAEVGGSGLGLLAQSLVLQEIGRTLAPLPYLATIAVAAEALAHFGTPAQQDQWLPGAINGTRILTVALTEPANRDASRPTTSARPDGARWRLNGTKTLVPSAVIADAILVPAWIADRPQVFLVESTAPGLTITAQATAAGDPTGQIVLDDVVVGSDALLDAGRDSEQDALAFLRDRATVAVCAHQLGVTERALEATAKYTSERVQFDRPIATFQAVGHRAADSYIDVEAIRLTLWQAIYAIEAGAPAAMAIHTAKWWAAEGGHRVAHAAVHLHGGMGIATEHSLHRYFAHAKQNEFLLGDATQHALGIGSLLATDSAESAT